MTPEQLILAALALPLAACLGCLVFAKQQNLRDGLTLIASIVLLLVVVTILQQFQAGIPVEASWWNFSPGIALAFKIEPLGLVFALVASSLWIATHVYGVGYMRGNKEKKHARFFACFAFAIFATMGIAFAANLLTP